MVGWLNLIVPRLAGGICVVVLSACDPTIPFRLACEAVDPGCMKGSLHRVDQMIGVPLETSRDGLIYSNKLNYTRDNYFRQMYYHGIEPGGKIILSQGGCYNLVSRLCKTAKDFKRRQKDISRINERFLRGKSKGGSGGVQIYIIDASSDTLRYELAVVTESKTKSFGSVFLRKCVNRSGQIRTKPPCWYTW